MYGQSDEISASGGNLWASKAKSAPMMPPHPTATVPHPKTAKTIITCRRVTTTRLDRLAGLYVTDDQGLLLAVAGRDINLTAAEVSNTGWGIESGNLAVA